MNSESLKKNWMFGFLKHMLSKDQTNPGCSFTKNEKLISKCSDEERIGFAED